MPAESLPVAGLPADAVPTNAVPIDAVPVENQPVDTSSAEGPPSERLALAEVARVSDELALTSSRSAKIALLASLLASTRTAAQARIIVDWLTGVLSRSQLGIGWGSVRDLPAPATQPSLDVDGVQAALLRVGAAHGPGSQAVRRAGLTELFSAATAAEQEFLRRALTGELRQGALAGVMADAIAKAARLGTAELRRAAMLAGDLATVAADALHGRPGALASYQLQVGRPISPMLAQPATGVADALSTLGGGLAAVEWKLDGIRVQVHRCGDEVSVYSRTLDDISARLPSICQLIRELAVTDLVADGELIALTDADRPYPFGVTSSQTASREPADHALTVFLFDVLRVDGADLLDSPASERRAALDRIAGPTGRIRATPRLVTDDPSAAAEFLADTLRHGHEGVLVKSLDAPYLAGRRGASWLKVKPVHTLDLVVLAVEHGSGRRSGTLSNIHLGARAADGSFVMLGKTFKGMTDEMLRWQTERFTELADGPTDGWVVRLRPEQVVEIAFDGLLRSTRYPGGVALRFARVLRYRDDKTAAEADTIETVLSYLPS